MTDINGTELTTDAPPAKHGIAIAEVPIDLAADQNIIEIKLRAPGIIRAAGYWLKTPSVIGSANMRTVEKVAMPLLMVECDPAGELQQRVFVFLASNSPFTPHAEFNVVYRATAIGTVGALHVFEIVEKPS